MEFDKTVHIENISTSEGVNGPRQVRVIALTGEKGGVGKTTMSINLAIALAQQGKRVLVFDGDLGIANIDVSLGLQASKNIADVMRGEASLEDIIIDGPGGIRIIPASDGMSELTVLSGKAYAGLVAGFNDLADQVDYLIVDTAPGISEQVLTFLRASQDIIVVTCDEPAAINAAALLMKVFQHDYGLKRFHLLVNKVGDIQAGRAVFNKLQFLSEQFTTRNIDYLGEVPFDIFLQKAIQNSSAVVDLYPEAKSSLAMHQLAKKIDGWANPVSQESALSFFLEHMLMQTINKRDTTLQ